MPSSTNLVLPYIAASQAQKHVTHNEAVRMLDALVQLAVADRDLATPPGSPTDGVRYIVAAGATGAWSGQSGKIAAYQDAAWVFYAPRVGWLAWVQDESKVYIHNGTAWVVFSGSGSVNPVSMVGVIATADATNRLSVKSDAVLLSHDDVTPGSGDMRMKLNKSAAARTASILLQNAFTSRAEIGLTGDNHLRVKSSPDGSTWFNSIGINTTNGNVGINCSPVDATAPLTVGGLLVSGGYLSTSLIEVAMTNPGFTLRDASGSTNNKYWDFAVSGGTTCSFRIIDDAYTTVAPWLTVTRSGTTLGTVAIHAPLVPNADNTRTLGSASLRWSTVYAATGTINTSDERLKTDIEDCPLGLEFVRSLSPKLYRWRTGGTDLAMVHQDNPDFDPDGEEVRCQSRKIMVPSHIPRPGRRRHVGLIAQDVKAALDQAGVDCGMWVLNDVGDPGSEQSVRYDQLIGPLVQAVKELAAEVEQLRGAIAAGA